MEGWLLKRSGGKDQKKSIGNVLAKWDKRYFALPGGTSKLLYYKTERDAERGKAANGELNIEGCRVERILDAGGESAPDSWPVMFSIDTDDRVLTLRTDSGDTLRLWVAAIVAAGGSAAPNIGQEQASLGGRLMMSASGKLTTSSNLFGMNKWQVASARVANTPSGRFRALSLPKDLESLMTLDQAYGEEDAELATFLATVTVAPRTVSVADRSDSVDGRAMSIADEQSPRKSFIESIGEGFTAPAVAIGGAVGGAVGGLAALLTGSSPRSSASNDASERRASNSDHQSSRVSTASGEHKTRDRRACAGAGARA